MKPRGGAGVSAAQRAARERHRLDPVAFRIAHEGGVIAGAVFRPRTGRAVGCAAAAIAAAWNACTASTLGARRQMCMPLSGSAGVMARRSFSQNSGYFLPKPMVPGRSRACRSRAGRAPPRRTARRREIAHRDGDVVDHRGSGSRRLGWPASAASRPWIHARDVASRRRRLASRTRPRTRIKDAPDRSLRPSRACASRMASRSAWAVASFFGDHPARAEAEDVAVLHHHRAERLIAGAHRLVPHAKGRIDEFAMRQEPARPSLIVTAQRPRPRRASTRVARRVQAQDGAWSRPLSRRAGLDELVDDGIHQRLERGVDDVGRDADRGPVLAGLVLALDQHARHRFGAAS